MATESFQGYRETLFLSDTKRFHVSVFSVCLVTESHAGLHGCRVSQFKIELCE